MNGALLEAFRHNAWATRQLVSFCADLTDEELATSATGTYGGIVATLNHIILSDGGYLRAPTGSEPTWAAQNIATNSLEELGARLDETERLWARFLSGPVDAERVVTVDDGAYEVRVGVIVAQAIHHGNAHREQISSILTGFGKDPPDLQVWAYAEATGRIWETGEAKT
jgi:uncharacterized damage-inducible protein DinB